MPNTIHYPDFFTPGFFAMSPIEEIIEEARKGNMFVLVDDENRENEGDLIVPANCITADHINFMVTHGRGLVCVAMEKERLDQLNIPMMISQSEDRHGTAFTVSVDARHGITTGISAPDRARTIRVLVDEKKTRDDLVVPGHVFPLRAVVGGVLERPGHTEAAVEIARLAGHGAAGVICEILNADGTMARVDDLYLFARQHKLKLGTIADLRAYLQSKNQQAA